MPQSKHKKTRQTNLARRAALPPHNSPDGRDRPEMAENGREMEIFALTFRQQSALPIVAVSRTVAQASRDSGVSEKTLRKWLEDPSFRTELELLRQESYDMARKQLQALMPHCLSIFAEMAAEADDPAIRLRAARYLMNYAVKFRDHDKVADDLHDLRAALLDAK